MKIKLLILLIFPILLFSFILNYWFAESLNHWQFISPIGWQNITNPIPQNKPTIPSFSLNSIFSQDHSWTSKLPADQTITLITTGDVIPGRMVNWKMTQLNDFTYPFASTAAFLKASDLTLINLEAPLPKNCQPTMQGMVFCGDQRFATSLKNAGVNIANLANNHSLNWGEEGLCQTSEILGQNNILAAGLPPDLPCISNTTRVLPKSLTTKTVKGIRFGFLGYNILDNPDQTQILEAIRQAKAQSDFLVVSFHWGAEYQRFPAEETVKLAHLSIDAGTDLVVGNHPHWYQPIEIYQGRLIVYAHGNFIFDQEWSTETKTGYIGKYLIYQGKFVDAQFFPVFIRDWSQPYFLKGQQREAVLEDLKRISLNLK